jgi:hypothetical protein
MEEMARAEERCHGGGGDRCGDVAADGRVLVMNVV